MIHLVLQADRREPVELQFEGLAGDVLRRARITAARFTSSKMPGTDRQPSSVTPVPSASRICGLQNTMGSCRPSETSMTIKRLWKSTWVAASPIPGAAYMVSNMSLRTAGQRRIEDLDGGRLGPKTGVRILKNLQARHDVPLDCC